MPWQSRTDDADHEINDLSEMKSEASPESLPEALPGNASWDCADATLAERTASWRERLQQHGAERLSQLMLARPRSMPQQHDDDTVQSILDILIDPSLSVAPSISTEEASQYAWPLSPCQMGSCMMPEASLWSEPMEAFSDFMMTPDHVYSRTEGHGHLDWHFLEEERSLRRGDLARGLREVFAGASAADVAQSLKAAQPESYED